VSPADLNSFLKVIEISDISSYITGQLYKGQADLQTVFDKITFKSRGNINALIRGLAKKDLLGAITSFHTRDLSAAILSGNFKVYKNLNALLYCISPSNLQAFLHGYDTANLNVTSTVGYQLNELQASLYAIYPKDIPAHLNCMKAQNIHCDLHTTISSVSILDLLSYIGTIESLSLSATITATGKYLDLLASIVPKVINIKRILYISLYEHSDLKATINYNCLKSKYIDLNVHLYPIKKLDLKAYLIGWYGNYADNVLELKAYINVSDYIHVNYMNCSADVYPGEPLFVTHNIISNKNSVIYKVTDTFFIIRKTKAMLDAFITGVLPSYDITATLTVKPLANFTTVPSWVNPKTLEVVINLDRFEERWRRFVEMMFFTNYDSDYYFFYVPGENNVYKVDRNRTWKIQVTGFTHDDTNIYSRIKVKKLFVFNLSNYNTFDEALSDLIDRVSISRKFDLGAYLNTFTFPSKDIEAVIYVKKIRHWSKALTAISKVLDTSVKVLQAEITPELFHGDNNLTGLIVGKSYEPPVSSDIHFNFSDASYIQPGSYNNMNWTYKQAEVFWKDV
jgi:hypothetical protein